MIHKDEELLAELRRPGPCWWCGHMFSRRDPHHVEPKGIGGGKRLDVPLNLFPMGPSGPGGCLCHQLAQENKITRESIEAVLASRLGLLQGQIRAAVHRLLRAPKGCKPCHLCDGAGVINKLPAQDRCAWCAGSGVLDKYGEPWRDE